MRGGKPEAIERWLVILIAVHSFVVGLFLLLLPDWSAVFGGWGEVEHRFFPRQGGVFHLVVAIGYLNEYFRHRTVSLMIVAKSMAVAFLLAVSFINVDHAWAVPLSAVSDGAMLVAVVLVHRWVRGEEGPEVLGS